jgi:hypothetical protein
MGRQHGGVRLCGLLPCTLGCCGVNALKKLRHDFSPGPQRYRSAILKVLARMAGTPDFDVVLLEQ